MAQLINKAQTDDSIKVILIHGGKNFSAGIDLTELMAYVGRPKEEWLQPARDGILGKMTVCLKALNNSIKPIVTVVRGSCVGIAFTYQSLVDFCYCGPDAKFSTPFMKSY